MIASCDLDLLLSLLGSGDVEMERKCCSWQSKITLGVFTNNDRARYCYESVGFQPVGRTEIYKMPVGEWECLEMELNVL